MNSLPKFILLVAKLRKAQKNAEKFKMRSHAEAAERLERDVDKELEQMGFESAKVKQMQLNESASKKTDEEPGTYNA
jgi:type IV pilus biogenesis protein CpaD/CtpE